MHPSSFIQHPVDHQPVQAYIQQTFVSKNIREHDRACLFPEHTTARSIIVTSRSSSLPTAYVYRPTSFRPFRLCTPPTSGRSASPAEGRHHRPSPPDARPTPTIDRTLASARSQPCSYQHQQNEKNEPVEVQKPIHKDRT